MCKQEKTWKNHSFDHKVIDITVVWVCFNVHLLTIFSFLLFFFHENCVICNKLKYATKQHRLWSKMFPSHPKCSPGTPAVPVLFFMSVARIAAAASGTRITKNYLDEDNVHDDIASHEQLHQH